MTSTCLSSGWRRTSAVLVEIRRMSLLWGRVRGQWVPCVILSLHSLWDSFTGFLPPRAHFSMSWCTMTGVPRTMLFLWPSNLASKEIMRTRTTCSSFYNPEVLWRLSKLQWCSWTGTMLSPCLGFLSLIHTQINHFYPKTSSKKIFTIVEIFFLHFDLQGCCWGRESKQGSCCDSSV